MTKIPLQESLLPYQKFDNSVPIPPDQVIPAEIIREAGENIRDQALEFYRSLSIILPEPARRIYEIDGITFQPNINRDYLSTLRICDVDIPDKFVRLLSHCADASVAKQKASLPISFWSAVETIGGDIAMYVLEDIGVGDSIFEYDSDETENLYFRSGGEIVDLVGYLIELRKSGAVEEYNDWILSLEQNKGKKVDFLGWNIKGRKDNLNYSINVNPDGSKLSSLEISQQFPTIPWRSYSTKIVLNGRSFRSIWHEAPTNTLFLDPDKDPNNYYPYWIDSGYQFLNKELIIKKRYPTLESAGQVKWEEYVARITQCKRVIDGKTGTLRKQTMQEAMKNLHSWRDHWLNIRTQVFQLGRSSKNPYQFRGRLGYRRKTKDGDYFVAQFPGPFSWLNSESGNEMLSRVAAQGIGREYLNSYSVEG